ncbi:hypothetical protein T439DRAFT_362017 [Meredithblackwellia eburnea MCA 4105]
MLAPILIASLALASNVAASTPTAEQIERGPIGGFVPVKWVAALAAALYGISTLVQWFRLFKSGRKFMLTLTIGMTCMTAGLALRIYYAENLYTLSAYIPTTMFTLLSPCAFLAMDYVLLNRLAMTVGQTAADDCLIIPARRIVKIFIWSDVITFLLQMGGGGLSAANNENMAKIAKYVTLIGLGVQLASFFLFTATLLLFGYKIRSKYPALWEGDRYNRVYESQPKKHWRPLFYVMCLTCVGILVRSFFRIAEYAGEYRGYLATHEGYFYLLDSLPLWISMSLFCYFWPPLYVSNDWSTYTMDSDSERANIKMQHV